MQAFNFRQWIDAHRAQLLPPVGNKRVFTDGDFIIMVVGGPNARKDFHVDPGQEFFYQLEGDMVLRTIQEGRVVDVPIRAGEVLLIPPLLPHSPQRPANSVGLVIERRAAPRRARRLPVVLRALRAAPVRGVLRAHRHREAVSAGIRALLRESRAAHLQPLRRGHGAQLVQARVALGGGEVGIDLASPVDLAVALDFAGAQPRHFGAPRASARPFETPGFGFKGSVERGASCNCEVITLIPHCNGTHTECAGHLTRERLDAWRVTPTTLLPALLLSVTPEAAGDESSDPAPQDGRPAHQARRSRGAVARGHAVRAVRAHRAHAAQRRRQAHARLHRQESAVPVAASGAAGW